MHQWEVKHYPNFLQAGAVSQDGWDLMKRKLSLKILRAADTDVTQKWTIAFMGSSVTTGRDTPVNGSFVALTEKYMRAAFKAVNIIVHSNQNAQEANPCMPYDLCVAAYAGPEADLVHWEQSYFCEGNALYAENFIRAALTLPNKPIVIFSHSATENWDSKVCDAPVAPYTVTPEDKVLLNKFHESPRSVFTEVNLKYDPHRQHWYHRDLYKAAGIQSYWHQDHQKYKCLGPFTKDWSCCSAPWHPSIKGNQLRAAHHVLLWMSIFREAVTDLKRLLTETPDVHAVYTKVLAEEEAFYKKNPLLPPRKERADLNVPDSMQCWTDHEPRTDRTTSLSDAVIDPNIAASYARGEVDTDAWNIVIADRLYYGDQVWKLYNFEKGYKDYKTVLAGDVKAGPVSLYFNAREKGQMLICDLAQNWGALKTAKLSAGDFGRLQKYPPLYHVTYLDSAVKPTAFTLDSKKAIAFDFKKYGGDDCSASVQEVNKGPFVLTITPQMKKKHLIAFILVP